MQDFNLMGVRKVSYFFFFSVQNAPFGYFLEADLQPLLGAEIEPVV